MSCKRPLYFVFAAALAAQLIAASAPSGPEQGAPGKIVPKIVPLSATGKSAAEHPAALASGGQPAPVNYLLMEWEWANRKSDEGNANPVAGYPITGSGRDLKGLAQRVYDEFSLASMK
jgi:hypothetical protein